MNVFYPYNKKDHRQEIFVDEELLLFNYILNSITCILDCNKYAN